MEFYCYTVILSVTHSVFVIGIANLIMFKTHKEKVKVSVRVTDERTGG